MALRQQDMQALVFSPIASPATPPPQAPGTPTRPNQTSSSVLRGAKSPNKRDHAAVSGRTAVDQLLGDSHIQKRSEGMPTHARIMDRLRFLIDKDPSHQVCADTIKWALNLTAHALERGLLDQETTKAIIAYDWSAYQYEREEGEQQEPPFPEVGSEKMDTTGQASSDEDL